MKQKLLIVALALFANIANAQTIGKKANGISLKDQFDKLFEYNFPNTTRTILVFADKNSNKQNVMWREKLSNSKISKLKIDYVPIAVLPWVPFFFKKTVKGYFLKEKSVLLDWAGELSSSYGYKAGECLFVYIGLDGYVKTKVSGEFTPEKFNNFIASIL